MQLESIKTFVVGNPPPGFGGRYFVFVKIRTACGIEGVGEAYAATFSPHVIATMAEDLFARVAVTQHVHTPRISGEVAANLAATLCGE